MYLYIYINSIHEIGDSVKMKTNEQLELELQYLRKKIQLINLVTGWLSIAVIVAATWGIVELVQWLMQ